MRLEAQARLIALMRSANGAPAAELADMIRYLMDQHGLTRADMVPILGTASSVSEVLARQEGAEHGDGAEIARPLPRAGRPAAAADEESVGRGDEKRAAPELGVSA